MKFTHLAFFLASLICGGFASENAPPLPAHGIATPAEFLSRIVMGMPVEEISLGAKHLSLASRKEGEPDIYFYLVNLGPTNRVWNGWMAPPGFRRVQCELLDPSGRRIPPRNAYITRSNATYKSYYDAPRNKRGIPIGRVWVTGAYPTFYDGLNLIKAFQIKHGGDYTLVAKGCVLKRSRSDQSLSLVELPPVLLPIHLSDEEVGPHRPSSKSAAPGKKEARLE